MTPEKIGLTIESVNDFSKFALSIELGNEAMQSPADVAGALLSVATKLKLYYTEGYIFDLNGNNVGIWSLE